MNRELLKIPTVSNWRIEVNRITSGERDFDISRLGNYGTYIENYFDRTPKDIRENSIESFFYVFEEYIKKATQSQTIIQKEIIFIFQVTNKFRDSNYLNSEIERVNYLTDLILKILDQKEKQLINNYEKTFYEYCRFLYSFSVNHDKKLFPENSIIVKKIIQALTSTIGIFNDSITNLAYYILLFFGYSNLSITKVDSINLDLIQYYLAHRNYNNQLLNNTVIDYAIDNKNKFEKILKQSRCKINSSMFNTIHCENKGKIYVKDLNPSIEQIKKLHNIFKTDKSPVDEFSDVLESKIKSHVDY